MPEIDLKHYAIYSKKLQEFAKAMGISILYKEYADDGEWDPWSRRITLNTDQSQSSEIASFLHELGHSLDDLSSTNSKVNKQVFRAYKAIYKSKATVAQKKLVLKFETTAWANGRVIASRLNISLGQWYDQATSHCLKAYRAA